MAVAFNPPLVSRDEPLFHLGFILYPVLRVVLFSLYPKKEEFVSPNSPGSVRPHVRTCSGKSWIDLGDATSSTRFLVPEIKQEHEGILVSRSYSTKIAQYNT